MLYHGGRLREYADMMRYAGFTHNHHRVDFRIAYNTWTEIPKTICRRALRKASKYPLVKINVLTDPDWSGILSVILSCYKYRIRPIDT